jgi:crotonobetainyl-CoA:carnitine CoA-transferase CaiB-like acyl-CoA transferase
VGALELKFWRNFCAAVGLDALTDVHWSTDAAQAPGSAGARATTAQVATHLTTQPRAHWLAQLAGADACAAPVLTPAEALAQPQVAARQLVHHVAGVTHVGPLAQIGGHAFAVAATETAGASSRTVLKEAGYSDSEIDALIAADVVGEAAT